eukprot:364794-Chlamydomonas_euryale.AAC.18
MAVVVAPLATLPPPLPRLVRRVRMRSAGRCADIDIDSGVGAAPSYASSCSRGVRRARGVRAAAVPSLVMLPMLRCGDGGGSAPSVVLPAPPAAACASWLDSGESPVATPAARRVPAVERACDVRTLPPSIGAEPLSDGRASGPGGAPPAEHERPPPGRYGTIRGCAASSVTCISSGRNSCARMGTSCEPTRSCGRVTGPVRSHRRRGAGTC